MTHFALIQITAADADDKQLSASWNLDPSLSQLGTAVAPGEGQSFPIDMAAIGTSLLISVASGIATEALVAGVKALFAKERPSETIVVTVEATNDAPHVTRVSVSVQK